jgi:hypothetical protein
VRDAVTTIYGQGIDILEVEIDLAAMVGQLALAPPDGRRADSATFAAITRLHAAVVLTAGEVIELLRAGFAAGATARWRTLYERAVIGHFISGAGEATADRYLQHGAVQLHKLATAIEAAEPGSMQTENQLDKLEARVATLTARHGSGFTGEYGWAGLALSGKNTDKGNFVAIENCTPSKEGRLLYRTASQEVHAGTHSPALGSLPYAPDYLLQGPTPFQLAGAGQVTAKWVYFSTVAVVAHASGPDALNGMALRCKDLAEEAHNFLYDAQEEVSDATLEGTCDVCRGTSRRARGFRLAAPARGTTSSGGITVRHLDTHFDKLAEVLTLQGIQLPGSLTLALGSPERTRQLSLRTTRLSIVRCEPELGAAEALGSRASGSGVVPTERRLSPSRRSSETASETRSF